MTPNPIRKVLSVMRSHRVRFLLMGGQACVLYGGAEFSRDTDIAILCEEPNLRRLREALDELHARQIAVPSLSPEYLRKGHAVHFRCRHPEAQGIRIVVMSVMRGVEGFPRLWDRRTTADLGEGEKIDLLSLPDLVAAKKTQRDKDWPIITRLVEANYASAGDTPTREQVGFWLKECRSPGLLRELAGRFPEQKDVLSKERALLAMIPSATDIEIEAALQEEEFAERRKDRKYWDPLRRELEHLRRQR